MAIVAVEEPTVIRLVLEIDPELPVLPSTDPPWWYR
jgi:hypothetical protein